VIDRFDTDPAAAVAGADLVLVAVPMGAMEAVFEQIGPHLAADAVITDVGSAKGAVVDAAQKAFGGVPVHLVPGHPIAGTERNGVAASFAELFQQRRVILTPLAHTDAEAVERVRGMWETAGAEVVEMGVEHHDRVLAATSHLPHILAYATVDSLARLHEHDEIFQYAAGGFRDFTRIAGSDPVMWRDICLANREAILEMIAHFQVDLSALTEAIQARDGERLVEIFARAKQARDEHAPQ
ncbi:MAG TPA: prephenate dehydrogenase/arogenate dehydrogenase family protein, partial [Thiohalobacter sp.]|nr:prephenate dehydrogenase/arogenate dehydrogenase family protein [Thiohalobacter sp.]